MALVPDMQRQNALAALARNGTEGISVILPEMQTGEYHQRQAFYD